MERFHGFRELGSKIKDVFCRKRQDEQPVFPQEKEKVMRQLVESVRSATSSVSIIATARKGHHVFDILPELVQVAPDVPVEIVLRAPPGTENDPETLAAIRNLLEIASPRENVDVRLMRVDPPFRPPIIPSNN